MLILKILLSLCLIAVFIQDIKQRLVHWFLFPMIGLLGAFLFYNKSIQLLFYQSIVVNLMVITLLIIVLLLYSIFKLKTSIFNTIGLGDILLFYALSFAFSSISFLILFSSSLIFSLCMHLIANARSKQEVTVPLAGYISIYIFINYLFFWTGLVNTFYSI